VATIVPRRPSIGAVAFVLASCTVLGCESSSDPYGLTELGDGSGYPGVEWTAISSPDAYGWSDGALDRAQAFSDSIGSHSVVVVDHGAVVRQWGDVTENLVVQSVRKSFMSALYGIAWRDGLVDLDATLDELGIDDRAPSLTDAEKQATVEHLLQSRSGVYHVAAAEGAGQVLRRPDRGSHPPGTYFYYNNWDFNVLGTILRDLTGEDTYDALYEHFAIPLQMQEFTPANGTYSWYAASEHPAYMFSMSARDMARFGVLFANWGRWRNEWIVPRQWVERSIARYSDASETWPAWDYGYMWWIGKVDAFDGHLLYAARGGGGHGIYVVPAMKVVVVHRVSYDTWRGRWADVDALVLMILAARGDR
jgi:CubicO group peptidase (beta-lactamase class C family)